MYGGMFGTIGQFQHELLTTAGSCQFPIRLSCKRLLSASQPWNLLLLQRTRGQADLFGKVHAENTTIIRHTFICNHPYLWICEEAVYSNTEAVRGSSKLFRYRQRYGGQVFGEEH